MHRLFAALRPPEGIRDALIDTMEDIEGARWQFDEQLHLTLRFAGEVDARTADDLANALSQVSVEPFALAIRGVGTFETKGRVTSLWAGVAPCEPLAILQRRVERACQRAGLAPVTRKFVPHITLARTNASTGPIGGWLADHERLALPEWEVERFWLYQSRLDAGGAQYEPLLAFPLTA
ncbi:RNA 2',3'-cyclic phosphodiesterase [Citromicrobium bathyomarinum]|uniref:RNA 2',3'-cyclic phosphodiesterase n=1 Tax=Citromicrobium bathyomarinum TaxID=72174 RepID=UPI00315AAA33